MKNQTTQPIAVCESNAVDSDQKSKKRWFTLTRQNQKGQVAIFVALIFQVIFVFFALLINVGLLVHHKINLQQSTDLAAYYGAMKQAEMLNVIGHVNFQIRQAWKLLTWRYRVLGTFGYQSDDLNLKLPIKVGLVGSPPTLEFQPEGAKCPPTATSPDSINLNDLPIFCVSHDGFADWKGSGGASAEACKIKCSNLDGAARPIATLSSISTTSVPGANVAGAVQGAINAAIAITGNICRTGTTVNAGLISTMLAAYFNDVQMKTQSIHLLTKNLLSDSNGFLDLDNKEVKLGAQMTLINNLTEANLSSLANNYKFLNGISSDNPSVDGCNTEANFMKELKFQFIQFFMNVCDANPPAAMRYDTYESIFENGTNRVSTRVRNVVGSAIADAIDAVSQNQLTLGFEKNPWCQVYYGVQAKTKPKIPFLPISQVELSAVSFAKPFGGSIGPWFYKQWPSGATESNKNILPPVDQVLPKREFIPGGGSAMKQNIELLLNYSNYVGDTSGLSDHKIIGIYHDFLLTRAVNRTSSLASVNRVAGSPVPDSKFRKPSNAPGSDSWPRLSDWSNTTLDLTDPNYDPLVMSNPSTSARNSGIRDLEISVVAPNQFDMTYYSIETDFYNNYYKGRLDNSKGLVDNLLSKHPGTPIVFKPDYGYSDKLSLSEIPDAKSFSVRDQLSVVAQVFTALGNGINQLSVTGTSSEVADKYFTFIPKSPASLLTGWTFLNLTNEAGYTTFPSSSGTMKFGQCEDVISGSKPNENYQSLAEAPYNLPPTPGNCITGGRTGYSVKIVSQEALTGNQGPIGGAGTSGPIRNPIPASFLNF